MAGGVAANGGNNRSSNGGRIRSGAPSSRESAASAAAAASAVAAASVAAVPRRDSSPTGSGDSEASADAVFREAMRRKGLSVVDVEPDGNCLFRSVSHQIYGDAERHYPVRKACVEHMSKHRARFGVFVAEDFRDYLYRIRQPGVWGDDLEIRCGRRLLARVWLRVYVRRCVFFKLASAIWHTGSCFVSSLFCR